MPGSQVVIRTEPCPKLGQWSERTSISLTLSKMISHLAKLSEVSGAEVSLSGELNQPITLSLLAACAWSTGHGDCSFTFSSSRASAIWEKLDAKILLSSPLSQNIASNLSFRVYAYSIASWLLPIPPIPQTANERSWPTPGERSASSICRSTSCRPLSCESLGGNPQKHGNFGFLGS